MDKATWAPQPPCCPHPYLTDSIQEASVQKNTKRWPAGISCLNFFGLKWRVTQTQGSDRQTDGQTDNRKVTDECQDTQEMAMNRKVGINAAEYKEKVPERKGEEKKGKERKGKRYTPGDSRGPVIYVCINCAQSGYIMERKCDVNEDSL